MFFLYQIFNQIIVNNQIDYLLKLNLDVLAFIFLNDFIENATVKKNLFSANIKFTLVIQYTTDCFILVHINWFEINHLSTLFQVLIRTRLLNVIIFIRVYFSRKIYCLRDDFEKIIAQKISNKTIKGKIYKLYNEFIFGYDCKYLTSIRIELCNFISSFWLLTVPVKLDISLIMLSYLWLSRIVNN